MKCFDGEITAIAKALQQLLLRPTAFKKVILLVESKSAIQAVASNKQATTQTVKEAITTIKLLNRQQDSQSPFSGSPLTQEYTATKQLTYWQKNEPHFKTDPPPPPTSKQ
jgi:hypothetical protein